MPLSSILGTVVVSVISILKSEAIIPSIYSSNPFLRSFKLTLSLPNTIFLMLNKLYQLFLVRSALYEFKRRIRNRIPKNFILDK